MKPTHLPLLTLEVCVALVFAAAVVGCDPDVTVCELPENLNTCEGSSDCLLVYCLVECCPCARPASERQYDETYCMVDVNDVDDYVVARDRCEEARDRNCDGVDCLDNPCPYISRAVCEGGICVAAEY